MTCVRIAGLCSLMVITSVVATAQQNGELTSAQPLPATTVTEYTYPGTDFVPLRRVERRTESGGRKVFIETAEAPDIEGHWAPLQEVVTESVRTAGTTETTKRDVFRPDAQRQRRLAETTLSDREIRGNTDTHTETTWVADLDGHFGLTARRVEETRSIAPGIQHTEATVLLSSPDRSLRGAERVESTEQQVNPIVVRHDNVRLVRDVNGRWLPIETRSGERRGVASAERVEQETVQRPNLTGTLVVDEKIAAQRSGSNGDDRVVIDTYSQGAEGFVRTDSRLALSQRVRRSTTVTADGGRSTVEEIEARDPNAPSDPMHVTQRTIVTERKVSAGRWVTERQVFTRDVNGRLALVSNDTEETTEK